MRQAPLGPAHDLLRIVQLAVLADEQGHGDDDLGQLLVGEGPRLRAEAVGHLTPPEHPHGPAVVQHRHPQPAGGTGA
jgi:hypothetical protein